MNKEQSKPNPQAHNQPTRVENTRKVTKVKYIINSCIRSESSRIKSKLIERGKKETERAHTTRKSILSLTLETSGVQRVNTRIEE